MRFRAAQLARSFGVEMYKVKFYNPATKQGFIDGYRTARRAKEVVATYQAQYEKDGNGLTAECLGKD